MTKYNYPAIIEDLQDCWESKLDDWERKFLESVHFQNYPLTDPQKKKILQISQRVKRGD